MDADDAVLALLGVVITGYSIIEYFNNGILLSNLLAAIGGVIMLTALPVSIKTDKINKSDSSNSTIITLVGGLLIIAGIVLEVV